MHRRLIRWGLAAVVLLFSVWLVITVVAAINFYQTLTTDVERLKTQLSASSIHDSLIDVSGSAQRLATLLLPLLPAVRLAGDDGCALANLTTIGNELSPYGSQFADAAAAAYDAGTTLTANTIDIHAVRAAWPSIAAQSLHATVERLMQLPACPNATERLGQYLHATQGILSVLHTVSTIPWNSVLNDSSRWLIALNNTDEIRGSGGFTTAVITIWVDSGVLHWIFGNSYSVDNLDRLYYHPNPPRPMQQIMAIHRWMFRDANWSPDYPTTATEALTIYTLDQQQPVSGMITINMTALPEVLSALPPVKVNGVTLDAKSDLDLLRSAWNEGSTQYNSDAPQRKQFILQTVTQLAQMILEQVHPLDLAAAGVSLDTMLVRRDVMFYAADPALEAVFANSHWDGSLVKTDGDYLMVVDSDIGYNKVTPKITSSIQYQVTLGSTPSAQLTLHYQNTNTESVPCSQVYLNWTPNPSSSDRPTTYADRMIGCFWDYIRVFTPPGTHITSFSGQDIPGDWFPFSPTPYKARIDAWHEGSYRGLGTMTVTPVDSAQNVVFDYNLPVSVISQEGDQSVYQLLVQRQAGSSGKTLTVVVDLPAGASLISAEPSPSRTQGTELTFDANLDLDRQFTIRYF